MQGSRGDGDNGWGISECRDLVRDHIAAVVGGSRWAHVKSAGLTAERLHQAGVIDGDLVCAVWLHDIGYAPPLAVSGFHPLDGARYLHQLGLTDRIVGLVGAHTGAAWEAAERGLAGEWALLPSPAEADLDVVTLVDLSTSPTGDPIDPADRITEILRRYDPDHPVHRAVTRSRASLMQAVIRARRSLRLSTRWPFDDAPK